MIQSLLSQVLLNFVEGLLLLRNLVVVVVVVAVLLGLLRVKRVQSDLVLRNVSLI